MAEMLKPEAQREIVPFAPPKPTLADGLLCLFDVFNTDLQKPKYQEGMARCFVKSGQFPEPSGYFYKYISHEASGLEKWGLLGPQVRITGISI